VKAGYLLDGDVPAVVKRASDHWEMVAQPRPLATANR
jgi:hypothetical protein